MGMFDYISIEDKSILPVPENFTLDLETFEFQTKSLEQTLCLYTIGKDNLLYQENHIEPTDNSIAIEKAVRKKVDFHGVINFGTYHITDLVSYSLEYEAKFTDGVLQNIKLLSFDKYEHKSRSESMRELLDKAKKRESSLYYKTTILLQDLLIVYPLKLFGLDFSSKRIGMVSSNDCSIFFYKPRFSRTKINTDYSKGYTLFLETDNEFSYRKYDDASSLTVKFLGFGFAISRNSQHLFSL